MPSGRWDKKGKTMIGMGGQGGGMWDWGDWRMGRRNWGGGGRTSDRRWIKITHQ